MNSLHLNPKTYLSEYDRPVIVGCHKNMVWMVYGSVHSDGLQEMSNHAQRLLQDIQQHQEVEETQTEETEPQTQTKETQTEVEETQMEVEEEIQVDDDVFPRDIYVWFTNHFVKMEEADPISLSSVYKIFTKSDEFYRMKKKMKLKHTRTFFCDRIENHDILKTYVMTRHQRYNETRLTCDCIVGWVQFS